jgi:putative DNA primase/helicase
MKTATTPQTIAVLAEGIPDELKIRPQWVNWKHALIGKGKWTKHPYNARGGRKASSTDLLTWSPFESAFKVYEAGRYDGIGFVFCSGDPYSGVDLDGCRDPQSGEIEPWAAEVVRDLASYTEISPSGRGLHVLVRGKVTAPLKRGQIEMYSVERYFTMTGQAVDLELG